MAARRFLAPALGLIAATGVAHAQSVDLAARLEGSQVVPPSATGASGAATVLLDMASGLATIDGSYDNLGTSLQSVVLHGPAPVGSGGSSVASLPFSGSQTGTFQDTVALDAVQVQEMRDGLFYLDLHTAPSGASELRGQILIVAVVGLRNGGTNPTSYAAGSPALGQTWNATVDLSTTGHTFAQLVGFDTPVDATLAGGQRLLCFDLGGSGEVLGLAPKAGPLAGFSALVPDDPALAGVQIYTQALHFGGQPSFALSNAQDLLFGL